MNFLSNVQVIVNALVSWYHELKRLDLLRFWPCYVFQLCMDVMAHIKKVYAYV